MAKYIIQVSDICFKEMCFSALEAYGVQHEGDENSDLVKETYGSLWGSLTPLVTGQTQINLEFLSTETSAARDHASVEPVEESQWMKTHIAESFWPETMLLGDFHTHPFYPHELNELYVGEGWQLSSQDKRSMKLELESLTDAYDYYVGLVMSVYMSENTLPEESPRYVEGQTALSFRLGDYVFFLSAYLAHRTSKGVQVTSEGNSRIELRCPFLFGNNFKNRELKGYAYPEMATAEM